MAGKVLVVDDSTSVRKLISLTLTQEGYEVLEASDGEEGFDLLAENEVKLVITDLNMPKLNGIELTQQIRQLDKYRFVPVIMLTTETETTKKQQGKDAGVSAWIVKPFQPEKLVTLVRMVIAK